MPAFLVPLDAGQCLIPLEKAIVLIGRQADCDVSLTHSRKISRKHCCIAQVNNTFIVRDLGSTNGVYLNGNRIQKEAMLTMGDNLVIGDVHFRMQNEAIVPKKKKAATSRMPADDVDSLPPTPAGKPIQQPADNPELSMDVPVMIPDGDHDFEVDVTKQKRLGPARKMRVDDLVPLDELDKEVKDRKEDAYRLASDSA